MNNQPILFLLLLLVFGCSQTKMSEAENASAKSQLFNENVAYEDTLHADNMIYGNMGADLSDNESVMEANISGDESVTNISQSNKITDDEPMDKKDQLKLKKKQWKRTSTKPNVAKIKVGLNESLTLTSVRTMVTIEGFRVRTVVDHVFYNPHRSNLEGDFSYQLPDNASISYFAYYPNSPVHGKVELDHESVQLPKMPTATNIYNKPIESFFHKEESVFGEGKIAHAVPKEKALQAYETVVRRGVDPALVEWAGNNTFTTKVFPLSNEGHHRVVIAYEQTLLVKNGKCSYDFSAPRDINFDFMLVANKNYMKNPNFNMGPVNNETDELISCHAQLIPEETQTMTFTCDINETNFIVGDDTAQGITYAYGSISPKFQFQNQASNTDKAIFLLDTSLSQEVIEFGKYMQLLEAILEKNTSIKYFNVLFFDIASSWLQQGWIENNNVGRAFLRSKTELIVLEGATDVALALNTMVQTPWLNQNQTKVDTFFLSNGQHTWGESSLKKVIAKFKTQLLFNPNFYCYNLGLGNANIELFNMLTQFGGGSFFSQGELEKLAIAHTRTTFNIENIYGDGITDMVIAGNAKSIYPGQQMLIACKITSPQSVIHVMGRIGSQQQIFDFSINTQTKGILAPRAFAELAVKKMENEENPELEDTIIAFCRYFSIPGKTCSLLMLDTKEDYDEFKIDLSKDSKRIENTSISALLENIQTSLAKSLASSKDTFEYFWNNFKKNELVTIAPKFVDQLLEKLTEQNFEVNKPKMKHDYSLSFEHKNYLMKRKENKDNYQIYLEEAEKFYNDKNIDGYLRCLSSIVELNPYKSTSLRVVGYCLLQKKIPAHAISIFERVRDKRSFEPQSYRDLAKSYFEIGNYEMAALYYEIILAGSWDERFRQLNQLVTDEYIRILKHALRKEHREKLSSQVKDFLGERIEELATKQETATTDLIVTITWNTSNTDVDLWVTEPNGERCYYQNSTTSSGGKLLADVTNGYGPERYTLQKAKKGKYKVEVQYYSSNTARLSDITFVEITVTKQAGSLNEKSYNHYAMLTSSQEKILIDNVKW